MTIPGNSLENLENQWKKVFDITHQSIKKAEIHQAKGYNNRQAKGKPFEIGTHVLKCNLQDQSHKCSLCKPFSRPYTVTGRSATGYFLHDRFSHQLMHSIPASQLVQFYETRLTKLILTIHSLKQNPVTCQMILMMTWCSHYLLTAKGNLVREPTFQISKNLQPQKSHKIQFLLR